MDEFLQRVHNDHRVYGAGRGVVEVDCLCGAPWPCDAIVLARMVESVQAEMTDEDDWDDLESETIKRRIRRAITAHLPDTDPAAVEYSDAGRQWREKHSVGYWDEEPGPAAGDAAQPTEGDAFAEIRDLLTKPVPVEPHPFRAGAAGGWGPCADCSHPGGSPVHSVPPGVTDAAR